MQEIRTESLLMLAIIPIGFIAFAIFLIVGAVRYFKKKDAEKEIYAKIARQMNWNFSARGEGLETAKPYFEYINKRILPERIRFGTFPVNLLWGNLQNALFAAFDYNYNNNPDSKNYNLKQEKGVLLISKNLNLPIFEVAEKNILSKGFDLTTGNSASSDFAKNYQIKTNNQEIINKFYAPEIARIFENSDIIRALGSGDFLCLFFRRNVEDLPDLGRIQFHLNATWQLMMLLK